MEIVVKEAVINKQCKKLELSNNQITLVGASIIAKALNNNTTLEILYLRGNALGDIGVGAIAKTLSLNNCKLGMLDLQRIGITDEGIEYLAEMLKINTMLVRLLLGNNEISHQGVERLANVLTHHNTTLLSIRIGVNKLISDSSVDVLVKMLKQNQTLGCLDISVCNLSENGKERLQQIAQSRKGFKLLL